MPRRRPREKGWLAHYREWAAAWAKRSGATPDTEDAAQDVALKFLEADGLAIPDHGGYFRRAVYNRSVSIHRSEALRATEALDELPEHAVPVEAGPESFYEADEAMRRMLAALEELPLACQQAFKLRQLEGMSNGEIAQRMGVSRNMVERYMARTTRHLQDRLLDDAP